ncbi:histone B4, putative [Brugia malayi]|uniref:Histone B4, putative n=2 Tax=Brugia malayi TaxID=6279 RepID=A0A4E9G101_BRUMA|nr:histone B4, putative [Brugia malayi]VIP00475.1 histone B4, putative [Brugia malayi]
MRFGGLRYASEQENTVFCEPQQRLQEPKVISNESNKYTVVGHTVEGQPIYALQSVRTQDRPRLHQDVRKISGDLVIQWKRLVSAPPQQVPEELKKVGSGRRKTPHMASGGASKAKMMEDNLKTTKTEKEVDGRKLKDISGNKVESSKKSPSIENPEKLDVSSAKAEKSMKASSSKTKVEKTEKLNKSAKAILNKLNEFNMFEKLDKERKEKKRRPKKAKTYTSKFRSIGLEGDGEGMTGKSNDSTMVTSKKKGNLPSKALLVAKKRTGVMMSNTFMDALMDPGHKKPPPKQAKKRSTLNLKPSISVIPSVMEGPYSDTSKSLNKEKQDEGSVEEKK